MFSTDEVFKIFALGKTLKLRDDVVGEALCFGA